MNPKQRAEIWRLRVGALVVALGLAMVAESASALPLRSAVDDAWAGSRISIGIGPFDGAPGARFWDPPVRTLPRGIFDIPWEISPIDPLMLGSPRFGRRGFVWISDDPWSLRRSILLHLLDELGIFPQFLHPRFGDGSAWFPLPNIPLGPFGGPIEPAPVAGPTTTTLVPEPGTAALLALGLISVALHGKRSLRRADLCSGCARRSGRLIQVSKV